MAFPRNATFTSDSAISRHRQASGITNLNVNVVLPRATCRCVVTSIPNKGYFVQRAMSHQSVDQCQNLALAEDQHPAQIDDGSTRPRHNQWSWYGVHYTTHVRYSWIVACHRHITSQPRTATPALARIGLSKCGIKVSSPLQRWGDG
ncbi:hypothetical protein FALCPG4_009362 [Fusarium falciforme]